MPPRNDGYLSELDSDPEGPFFVTCDLGLQLREGDLRTNQPPRRVSGVVTPGTCACKWDLQKSPLKPLSFQVAYPPMNPKEPKEFSYHGVSFSRHC